MQLCAANLSVRSMEKDCDNIPIQECLIGIKKHLEQAGIVVSEINRVLQEVAGGRQLNHDSTGNPTPAIKPSKRMWIRRKATLARLTVQVTSIVRDLMATLQVLQAHKSSSCPVSPNNVVIQNIGTVQEQPQVPQTPDSVLPLEQQIERTIAELANGEDDNVTNSSVPSNIVNLSRQSSIESFHSFTSDRHQTRTSSFVSLRGTLATEQCRPFCRCQCHLSTHVNMPAWAKGILGSINFHGNSSILLNRRPCNLQSCGRGGSATVQLSYYAPAWLFWRNFNIHLKVRSGCSVNSFSLKTPRVIPGNALVWSMIEFGRFKELRQMIVDGKTSPHDVSDFGSSVLYVSLAFRVQHRLLTSKGVVGCFQRTNRNIRIPGQRRCGSLL